MGCSCNLYQVPCIDAGIRKAEAVTRAQTLFGRVTRITAISDDSIRHVITIWINVTAYLACGRGICCFLFRRSFVFFV